MIKILPINLRRSFHCFMAVTVCAISVPLLYGQTKSEPLGNKDVWYDARGNVYKITPRSVEKPAFIPEWKKRELEREARRRAGYQPVQRAYTYYGHPYYIHPRFYHPARRYHIHSRQPFRFRASYHGNGWSVHIRR